MQSSAELVGRNVNDVQIVTPLAFPSATVNRLFFSSLGDRLARLKTALAIQKGKKFTEENYNAGRLQIAGAVQGVQRQSLQRIQVTVTAPALEDCDANGLTVVYRIYSTDVISSAISMVEINPTKITQSLAPLAAGFNSSHVISPVVGYNASRGVFGGTAMNFKMDGGIFQTFHVSSTATTGSGEAEMSLSGQRDFGLKFLNLGEWRIGYNYSNDAIAHSPTKLHAGTLDAQFLGSTRPSVLASLMGRYGVAVEGGNRQANLSGPNVLGAIASASYGALKGYAGVSFGIGRDVGAASYGIQVGKSPGSIDVGYTKHLIDLKFKQRFLPKPHVPIQLDSGFNAGWIQSSSHQVPVLERFYGGNVAREFVSGDSWKIQDGPQLRSFPQFAFNSVPGGPFGATRFLSANFTFASTLRHYPAVPDDVLLDPALRTQLGFQLKVVKEVFVGDCEARTSLFPVVVTSLQPVRLVVTEIESWNTRLNAASLPQAIADLLSDFDGHLDDLKEDLARVASKPKGGAAVGPVRRITTPSPGNSLILQLADSGDALAAGVVGSSVASEEMNIRESARKLREEVKPAREAFAKVEALNTADPARYDPVLQQMPMLKAALEALQPLLDALSEQKDDAVAESRDAVHDYLVESVRKVNAATASGADVYSKLDDLLKDWGAVAPASPKSVLEAVAALQKALLQSGGSAQSFDAPAAALKSAFQVAFGAWSPIKRPPIQSCALAEAGFVFRAADASFRELNLFQVSPVGVFDLARLSTPGIGSTGLRYAAGPGVRLSLATLNITLGYAFNLEKRTKEGNGAFFFSLDVSDLFR